MRFPSLLVLVLVAGCLPSRDNDFDPTNAPAPFLSIVDRSGPSGCESVETTTEWQPLTVATRATCLALDASETTDPQGTGTAKLRFTFERIDDETSPEPVGTPLQEAMLGGSVLLLPEALVSTLPVGGDTVFRVTVTDPTGARGRSTAHVTLVNSAPIVTTGPTLFLPLGGRPWETPDMAIPVTLHAFANDAEGDPITSWQWTDDAGTPVGISSSNLSAVIDVSVAGTQHYFVTASDGNAVSLVARASVAVGDAALWAGVPGGSDNFVSISRLGKLRGYDDFYSGATPSSVFGAQVIRSLEGGSRLVFVGNELVLVRWPELDVVDTEVPPPFASQATAAVVDGERLWIASPSDGSVREIAAFDLPGGDSIVPVFGPFTISSDPGFEDTYVATDSAGNLWISGQFEQTVRAVSAAPAVLGSASLPAGSGFRALASRPGNPDMWAIAGQTLESDLPQPALLRLRVDASGVELTTFPLDTGDADGLAWIDGDRFWTYLGERGVCLVDASILEAGGSLDAAIEVSHPTTASLSVSVSDPGSEGAWFASAAGSQAAFVDPSGLDLFPSFATPQALDAGGGLWFTRFGYAFSGVLADDGIASKVGTTVLTATPDGEGGLWTVSLFPRALTRLGSDGTPLDFISELDLGGGDVRTLPLTFLATSDGEGRLYLAGAFDFQNPTFSFVEVDVRGRSAGSPPRTSARIIVSGITTFPSTNLFNVSPPGSNGYLWWIDPFAMDSLLRTSLDGTTTVPVIAASTLDSGAVSPVSGDVCWGRHVDFDTIELYVITSAGGPSFATNLTATAGTFLFVGPMAVGVDPVTREETCWIGYTEENVSRTFHLEEYDRNGVLLRSYLDVGEGPATSIVTTTEPGVVWALRASPTGGPRLQLFQWDSQGFPIRFDLGETTLQDFFR